MLGSGVRGGAVGWGVALQNRKVARSTFDRVFVMFYWLNLNGSTQPLTEISRLRLKNYGTRAEKPDFVFRRKGRVHLNRRGASVQSTTGSRGVRISSSNAGYTMFRGSVKGTGYPLHSPVSPSLPHSCGTVCHHISTALYQEYLLGVKAASAKGWQPYPPPSPPLCRLSSLNLMELWACMGIALPVISETEIF